jgi:hypothetical protein
MSKTILFDLDQTLGFFEQMIHIMNYSDLTCHELLTLFPEFFRPLLLDFLKSLIPHKQSGKIKSILIYSNNNNEPFVKSVIDSLHQFLGGTLFDEVITLNHPRRRNKQKDYQDLLFTQKGALDHSILCFVDDKRHPLMNHPNVVYIQCEGYRYYVKHASVLDRIKRVIPEYISTKRCLNRNNQQLVSKMLIQRIRMFISKPMATDYTKAILPQSDT